MTARLALHTWSLDTTPLADLLRVARVAGWDGVELRRRDFDRAADGGQSAEAVLDLVRASGLPVACVGAVHGWMYARGAERQALLRVLDEQCARAGALGCRTVMSPADQGRGDVPRAADSVREAGDLAARHGVRLAIEPGSQAEQLRTLTAVREVLALAGHPACGLLLDSYHLWRSGASVADLADVAGDEIVHVQFSDVPGHGGEPGDVLDRLPPGHGIVPFAAFFAALAARGYAGWMSYEAPNPEAWARDPADVAAGALAAARSLLGRSKAPATSS